MARRSLGAGLTLFAVTLLGLTGLGVPSSLRAGEVTPTQGLPEGLPEWLSPLLDSNGYSVTNDLGAELTFWFREVIPEQEPRGDYNVEYGTLAQGTLIGVVEVKRVFNDYRKQDIQPGLYTLRFGIQPPDGDHTGVTYFRDFMMFTLVEKDSFPTDGVDPLEPLIEASSVSCGTEHPGVLGVYRIYDPIEETQLAENDFGEPTFVVVLPSMTFGLVMEGHGHDLQI